MSHLFKWERSYFAFGRRAWTSRKGNFSATVDLDQLKLQWTDNRHLLVVVCRCKRQVVLSMIPVGKISTSRMLFLSSNVPRYLDAT